MSAIPDSRRQEVQKRDKRRCVRCGAPCMGGHWHHRRSRSVKDQWTHSSANGIWLCPTCHTWVHAHPFEAKANGWIVSRYAAPHLMPLLCRRRGWILIDDDGDYETTEIEDG